MRAIKKGPMKTGLTGLVVACFLTLAATASAATVGFSLVPGQPDNSTTQALEDILQLDMEVSTIAPNLVKFHFHYYDLGNTSLADSKIKEIFFGDSNNLFSTDTTPIIGGSMLANYTFGTINGTHGFTFTPDYSLDKNGPAQMVPGKDLSITFTLNSGKTFADGWAAFNSQPDPLLNVGIHVQSLPESAGGSVKLENNPVPVPAGAWLLGAGLLGLIGLRRKNS